MSNAFNKKAIERVEDMHLQLAEKYQGYKDLSERCLLNPQYMGKFASFYGI